MRSVLQPTLCGLRDTGAGSPSVSSVCTSGWAGTASGVRTVGNKSGLEDVNLDNILIGGDVLDQNPRLLKNCHALLSKTTHVPDLYLTAGQLPPGRTAPSFSMSNLRSGARSSFANTGSFQAIAVITENTDVRLPDRHRTARTTVLESSCRNNKYPVGMLNNNKRAFVQ